MDSAVFNVGAGRDRSHDQPAASRVAATGIASQIAQFITLDATARRLFAVGATLDGPPRVRNIERPPLVTTTVSTMSNFGFGFGLPGDPNDPNDLSAQMPLFAELQKLMSWSGGPVNWDLAKQLAVSTMAASGGGGSIVSPADRVGVAEAIRLADLWLDDATEHADRKIRGQMGENMTVYNQIAELTSRIKTRARS